jgi:outer membrane receptor protein involved in Fe transport
MIKTLTVLAYLLSLAGVVSLAFGQTTISGPFSSTATTATIGEIAGQVFKEDTGEALYAASVGVWNAADSTLVTGAASDQDGHFYIDRLVPGEYFVQISFIGYETITTKPFLITEENRNIDLGRIGLTFETGMLEAVVVTAERADVAFEIDRTVYNTKNQISSSGGSATDVLQNIPSVEVDIDGNVSLRGNQNLSVLINGKPSPLKGEFLTSFLQQLPASSIDRVEVIPNPSAKYDPDGQAGALNIVLKKEAELGTSGGITLGGGSNGEYNASGNFNLQKGKLTLFANYGFRRGDRDSEGYNFRENRFLDPLSFVEQDNFGTSNSLSHVINTNVDYALSERSTLSLSGLLSSRSGDGENVNSYAQLGSSRNISGRYDRLNGNESDRLAMDYSLSFRRTIEASKNEFSAEVRYSRSRGDDIDELRQRALTIEGLLSDLTPEIETNEMDNLSNDLTVQVDITRPLGQFRLETGVKGTLRQLDNQFLAESFDYGLDAFLADLNRSNEFLYDERIAAGYGIVSGGLGKFEAQAGVRVEQAMTSFDLTTTNETYDNDYFSVFPSAFLAYNLSQTGQLKASYSKRISRPRTSQLNPFTSFVDPLNLRVGNPQLQPEYIHAFELSFQQITNFGSVSITPYFRRTVDEMQRYKSVDENGVSTLTFRNFDKSDSYGAELIGSMRLGQKLSGFASFNAYKVVTDGSNINEELGNDAISWSTRASATWQVRGGTDVQLFYFYRAPRDVAQGRISSFSMANISIRQKLLQDRASLTLRVSDPFDQMGFQFEVDDDTFYQLGTRKWESQSASLTFTYNFGKPPRRRPEQTRRDDSFDDFGIN